MEQTPSPRFDTPEAAALYYRRKLGIRGRATIEDASRLLSHFPNRLTVFELGNEDFAYLFPYGKGWRAIVPHPRCARPEDYERGMSFVLASWLMRGGHAWLAEIHELPSPQRRELMLREADAFLAAWRGRS